MVATVRHVAARLGDCVRCFTKTKAVTSLVFTSDGETYELNVCDAHADMFTNQMLAWIRVATILLPVETHRREPVPAPPPAEPQREALPVRIAVPAAVAVATADEEEEDVREWAETIPPELKELALAHPGVQGWKCTRKAVANAREADVHLIEVLLAAEVPETTRKSEEDPDAHLHTRGGVTAIVHTDTKTVVTMFYREERITSGKAS